MGRHLYFIKVLVVQQWWYDKNKKTQQLYEWYVGQPHSNNMALRYVAVSVSE